MEKNLIPHPKTDSWGVSFSLLLFEVKSLCGLRDHALRVAKVSLRFWSFMRRRGFFVRSSFQTQKFGGWKLFSHLKEIPPNLPLIKGGDRISPFEKGG
jgi:hypothetical protein